MITSKIPNDNIMFYICGVSNIGVGSYHNYMWKQVNKGKIDCFVLLLGINNLLRPDCDDDDRESLEDTFEKIKEFIEDIISTGNILVQMLYPTDRLDINSEVVKINQKLKNYCEDKNINYLDLYNELLGEDGIINPIYCDDGIHPNVIGYKLIIDSISKKLELEENKISKKIIAVLYRKILNFII